MSLPGRICAALTLCIVSTCVHALESEVIKTKSGCEITHPKAQRNPDSKTVFSYEWDGPCVGGKAQGLGKLLFTIQLENDAPKLYATTTQTRNAGIVFGYMTIAADVFGKPLPAQFHFLLGDTAVSFTKGWGLSHEGLAVGGASMAIPVSAPFEVFPFMNIKTNSRRIYLLESACILYKEKINDCRAEEAGLRKVYEIHEQTVQEDGALTPRASTLCPDPFAMASCAPLLQRMSAPLQAEILVVLQRSKPAVDELLLKINAGQPGAVPPPSASATRPAPVDLNALQVGALYAAADQAIADGDTAGARAALRALIRRFPDHALAAAAARRLSELAAP